MSSTLQCAPLTRTVSVHRSLYHGRSVVVLPLSAFSCVSTQNKLHAARLHSLIRRQLVALEFFLNGNDSKRDLDIIACRAFKFLFTKYFEKMNRFDSSQ